MKVYGLWDGGHSYSESDMDSLEVFPSIADAKYQLFLRYGSNGIGPVKFDYVNREPEYTLTPAVDKTSRIRLFLFDPREYHDGISYPDRIVYFGPKGGVRVRKVIP